MEFLLANKVRYFRQIVSHLSDRYGAEKTASIMDKALKRNDEIITENKDEPKEYHMHTLERIYPAIAMFDAMSEEGIDRKETAQFLIDYYKWRSSKLAPIIKTVFKIPGLYRIVPEFFF